MFGLLELYLLVRYNSEQTRLVERYEGRSLCTRSALDRRLVWELIPNKCGHNSHGFNDAPFNTEKPPDTFRIIVIGDSVAEGRAMERGERFTSQLSGALQEASRRQVEVFNLAREGYSTSQELIILERYGLNFSPDLIVWSYVLNDPAHPVYHDASGQLGRYFVKRGWLGLHYIQKKIFDAKETFKRKQCPDEFHERLHCIYRDDIAANIRQISEFANEVPVVFAVHPVFIRDRIFPDYEHAQIHADIVNFALSSDLTAVDLTPAFRGLSANTLTQFYDDEIFDPWHLNSQAHKLTAHYLARKISSAGLLTKQSAYP